MEKVVAANLIPESGLASRLTSTLIHAVLRRFHCPLNLCVPVSSHCRIPASMHNALVLEKFPLSSRRSWSQHRETRALLQMLHDANLVVRTSHVYLLDISTYHGGGGTVVERFPILVARRPGIYEVGDAENAELVL